MPTIIFSKIKLGRWQRMDAESKLFVNEEAMHREIQKLILDGWTERTIGLIHEGSYHAREYRLSK